jgi:LPS sulfotransferase NodH
MNPNPPFKRPDVVDLAGPEYDRPSEPAKRTLIICAGPRTGSTELCRHLIAAGIGVLHEYFHPYIAGRMGVRWGVGPQPLDAPNLARYIETLRSRRTQGGVFGFKLMFHQFEHLQNAHGAALFEAAQIVHLYRPDVAGQFASLRVAMQTGFWDFSDRGMGQFALSPEGKIVVGSERKKIDESIFDEALRILDFLIGEDAGFRKLFALLGIRPMFVNSEELFRDPGAVVRRIAAKLEVPVNEARLEESIGHGGAYKRESRRQLTVADFSSQFKQLAFKKP